MLAAAIALTAGCEQPPTERRAPPAPTAKAQICDAAPHPHDPRNVAPFPPRAAEFCIDPAGSDLGFGDGAERPLAKIAELFDGEADVYHRFGVKRVVAVHYVDAKGSAATIDVYLSQYQSTEGAYAMFTKRVVGDGDPAGPDTAKPIGGGGAAALGIGNAYLWRGPFVAELTYNDTAASVEVTRRRGTALLPPLVKALGERLTGAKELPAAARALPAEHRLAAGIRFIRSSLLGVDGSGPGAFGYYRDGTKRWRVLSAVAADEDQATDVLHTMGKARGATLAKGVGEAAITLMLDRAGEPRTEWLVARRGKRLVGVGDEPRVLRPGMTPIERHSKTLGLDEKRELVTRLVASPH